MFNLAKELNTLWEAERRRGRFSFYWHATGHKSIGSQGDRRFLGLGNSKVENDMNQLVGQNWECSTRKLYWRVKFIHQLLLQKRHSAYDRSSWSKSAKGPNLWKMMVGLVGMGCVHLAHGKLCTKKGKIWALGCMCLISIQSTWDHVT